MIKSKYESVLTLGEQLQIKMEIFKKMEESLK